MTYQDLLNEAIKAEGQGLPRMVLKFERSNRLRLRKTNRVRFAPKAGPYGEVIGGDSKGYFVSFSCQEIIDWVKKCTT